MLGWFQSTADFTATGYSTTTKEEEDKLQYDLQWFSKEARRSFFARTYNNFQQNYRSLGHILCIRYLRIFTLR